MDSSYKDLWFLFAKGQEEYYTGNEVIHLLNGAYYFQRIKFSRIAMCASKHYLKYFML